MYANMFMCVHEEYGCCISLISLSIYALVEYICCVESVIFIHVAGVYDALKTLAALKTALEK